MEITNYRCSSCSYESHCYIILKHHIKVTHEARDSTNLNEIYENDTKLCSCEDCKYENELRAVLSGYFQTQQKPENEVINFVDVAEGFEVNPLAETDTYDDDIGKEVSAANFLEEEIRIEVVDSDQDDRGGEHTEESENNNVCASNNKEIVTNKRIKIYGKSEAAESTD